MLGWKSIYSLPWARASRGCPRRADARAFGQSANAFFPALLAACLLLLSRNVAVAADAAPAMIVPGQLTVSDSGAFNYQVPIAIPPGTAGMEPALSLNYSSQGGDGTVGWGWSLSGIPSIGRCARTNGQDNVHGSVNFDNNDRYCLDGQRLVAISGSYGADGTIYRTELDSFSKIVARQSG